MSSRLRKSGIAFIKFLVLGVFPYAVVFLSMLYVSLDTDLGWHLKYGEYFFQHGSILGENTFAVEMPDYKWVNSSWGTDILSYSVFNKFGFLGISVLGALTMVGTFFVFSKAFRLTFWEKSIIFPVLVFSEEPLTQVSFRGHLVSLLFTGILMYCLESWRRGKKFTIFLTIPLFLFWVNIHGEFILGIMLMAIWLCIYLYLSRPLTRNKMLPAVLSFAGSVGATLINPFGFGVYLETLKHFGNPMQKYIVEWLPFDTYSFNWWQLVVWVSLVLLGIFLYWIKGKLKAMTPMLGIVGIMLFLSFTVRRYTWPMLLLSIPFMQVVVASLKWDRLKFFNTLFAISIFVGLCVYQLHVRIPKLGLSTYDWNAFCANSGCSPLSAQVLDQMKNRGKTLTFYNWGGYLIWNYPDLKPTIDGRMHLWRSDDGYSAFEAYYPYEQNWVDVDLSDYNTVYMATYKPLFTRMQQLVEEKKWVLRYRDQYAGIFQRAPILPSMNK